jgi:hypothetical protein
MILREIWGNPEKMDKETEAILMLLKQHNFVAGSKKYATVYDRVQSSPTTIYTKNKHQIVFKFNDDSKSCVGLHYNGPLGSKSFMYPHGGFSNANVEAFASFLKSNNLQESLFGLVSDGMALSEREADKFIKKHNKENSKHLLRFVGLLTNTPVKKLSSRALFAKVKDLADQLGIKIVRHNSSYLLHGDTVQWDGNILKVSKSRYWGLVERPLSFLHEVCHWQAAPMPYRMQPDYALGPIVGPDKELDKAAMKRPPNNRAMDESITLFLSICWLVKWNQKVDSFELLFPSQPVDTILDTMIAAGLIDQDYQPRAVARISENKIDAGRRNGNSLAS